MSVVTPVRNSRRYISEALESVRRQDYPHLEHIVVDGGSRDGTLELLQRASAIRWVTGPDRGMYDAINKGFDIADGDVLAYQNADDRYAGSSAISKAIEVLESRTDVDLVYGDFRVIDEEGTARGRRGRPGVFSPSVLASYSFVPPHSTFVRARIVKERGHRFDPKLQYAGDWDWFLGMARAGVSFYHLEEVLSDFRIHASSKTNTLGWLAKLQEWKVIARRHDISLLRTLWCEFFYVPARRRLGLPLP